jgi:hypothetical protein
MTDELREDLKRLEQLDRLITYEQYFLDTMKTTLFDLKEPNTLAEQEEIIGKQQSIINQVIDEFIDLKADINRKLDQLEGTHDDD